MAASKDHYEKIITSLTQAAVSQVDGVADLSLDSGATFTGRMFRSPSSSIKVILLPDMTVSIDASIKAYYGYKVPELAFAIQQTVKDKVEQGTPYKVRDVNVNVVGVVFR